MADVPPDLPATAPPRAQLPALDQGFEDATSAPLDPGVAEQFGVVERIAELFRDVRDAALDLEVPDGEAHTAVSLADGVEPESTDDAVQPAAAAALFEFGPLRVVERVGSGGFGEVFRAWDPRLARDVALKLIRDDVSQVPGAVQAALREGKLLARIRNPHVMTIHGADLCDGRVGLWGEFLTGRTLSQIVEADGPMSAEECVVVGEALCQALGAVHAAGVLHRDIKAQNVIRATGGRLVLTDFGIGIDLAQVRRGSLRLVGTPLYLAPELITGGRPSVRSDIYAVGVLLFYLSTGRFPVSGSTFEEIARAHHEGRRLGLRDARPDLPAAFIDAVESALESQPEFRCASAGDLGATLRPARTPGRDSVERAGRWKSRAMAGAISTAAALLALAVAASRTRVDPTRFGEGLLHFSIAPPGGVALTAGSRNVPAVSPDGLRIAFVGTDPNGVTQVWVRTLDRANAAPVAGTEGAEKPTWSPDGRSLLFVSREKLLTVKLGESSATRVADMMSGGGASWSREVIAFVPSPRAGVHVTTPAGGVPRQVTTVDHARGEIQHLFPSMHDDGRHFLYYVVSRDPDVRGIYLGRVDGAGRRRLVDSVASGVFSGDDVLYLRDDSLVYQRCDLRAGVLVGTPGVAAEGVGATWTSQGSFSVSLNGVLAYVSARTRDTRRLVWTDRDGNHTGLVDEGERFRNPSMSPDGTALVVERYGNDEIELRVYDLVRGRWSRIGERHGRSRDPVWSGDSSMVAFVSDQGGDEAVLALNPEWRGPARTIWSSATAKMPTDWSPDGRWIAVVERADTSGYDAWVVAADGSGQRQPVAASPFNEVSLRFSRDGRWVAYCSDESGRFEVYVERFPSTGRRRMASVRGAMDPSWGADGRLMYLDPSGALLTVDVPPDEREPVSAPRQMFVTGIDTPGSSRNHYAANADTSRFILNLPFVGRDADAVDVVVNWRTGAADGTARR